MYSRVKNIDIQYVTFAGHWQTNITTSSTQRTAQTKLAHFNVQICDNKSSHKPPEQLQCSSAQAARMSDPVPLTHTQNKVKSGDILYFPHSQSNKEYIFLQYLHAALL